VSVALTRARAVRKCVDARPFATYAIGQHTLAREPPLGEGVETLRRDGALDFSDHEGLFQRRSASAMPLHLAAAA
jgi:hypothetical protein